MKLPQSSDCSLSAVASLHGPNLTCTRNFHFPSFRLSRTTRYPDCYVSSLSSDGARQTQTWTFVVEERLQNYRNPQSLKLTRLKTSASRLERNPVPWFQCKEICLPINEAFLCLLRPAVVSPVIRLHWSVQRAGCFSRTCFYQLLR